MSAGPSKSPALPHRPTSQLVKSHESHSSIRALSAKSKQKKQDRERARQDGAGEYGPQGVGITGAGKGKGKEKVSSDLPGGADKDVIKTVLASPLTPRWPKISDAQQHSILKHLLTFFPGLANYHLARGRNNKKRKKHNRALLRQAGEGEEQTADETTEPVDKKNGRQRSPGPEDEDRPAKRIKTSHAPADTAEGAQDSALSLPAEKAERPLVAPPCAPHMVIGINETMKAMEWQTADLMRRIQRLRGTPPSLLKVDTGDKASTSNEMQSKLIPTAPFAPDAAATMNGTIDTVDENGHRTVEADSLVARDPLRIIFVALPDINPPHLVHAIPLYATTWNSAVREYRNLQKQAEMAGSTGKGTGTEHAGQPEEQFKGPVEETLLVPLPKGGELKIAEAFGLRRVAVFGLNASFPDLDKLLKTVISANIKVMLPPFPIIPSTGPLPTSAPYAPTHLKAVLTTAPADAKARKAARIAGVKAARERQREAKLAERARKRKEGVVILGMLCGGTDGIRREKLRVRKEKRRERDKERRIAAAAAKANGGGDASSKVDCETKQQTALPRLLPTAPPSA